VLVLCGFLLLCCWLVVILFSLIYKRRTKKKKKRKEERRKWGGWVGRNSRLCPMAWVPLAEGGTPLNMWKWPTNGNKGEAFVVIHPCPSSGEYASRLPHPPTFFSLFLPPPSLFIYFLMCQSEVTFMYT